MDSDPNTDAIEDSDASTGAMDKLLYLIKDHLPKGAISNLDVEIGNIKAVKETYDFQLYIVIEFRTKLDAEAAKAAKYTYTLDGQEYKVKYASFGALSAYITKAIKPGMGSGF